jgi:hypothetical protein
MSSEQLAGAARIGRIVAGDWCGVDLADPIAVGHFIGGALTYSTAREAIQTAAANEEG